MVDVPVNGKVLAWARKERHLSVEDAANLLGVPSATLIEIERSERKPTLGFLRSIASKYEVPLAALLMPEPQPLLARPTVTDHRTFKGAKPEYSPKLQSLIDESWYLVDALSDLKNAAPDLFIDPSQIPHTSAYVDMEKVANAERERIGISVERQNGLAKPREAFLTWRHVVEAQGVFVTVANAGGDDNCRGFAINDGRNIPFIFLNSDESEADHDYKARCFSLMHEYCHVMMRQNALSDHKRSNKVESACNTFAAFFLMPRSSFNRQCQILGVNGTPTEWHVVRLANIFHTSLTSVGYHLEATGNARRGFGKWFRRELEKRKIPTGSGRAQHTEKLANRLGGGLISVILNASDRGILNNLDVHEITRIKPKYFGEVRGEVDSRAAAYGVG